MDDLLERIGRYFDEKEGRRQKSFSDAVTKHLALDSVPNLEKKEERRIHETFRRTPSASSNAMNVAKESVVPRLPISRHMPVRTDSIGSGISTESKTFRRTSRSLESRECGASESTKSNSSDSNRFHSARSAPTYSNVKSSRKRLTKAQKRHRSKDKKERIKLAKEMAKAKAVKVEASLAAAKQRAEEILLENQRQKQLAIEKRREEQRRVQAEMEKIEAIRARDREALERAKAKSLKINKDSLHKSYKVPETVVRDTEPTHNNQEEVEDGIVGQSEAFFKSTAGHKEFFLQRLERLEKDRMALQDRFKGRRETTLRVQVREQNRRKAQLDQVRNENSSFQNENKALAVANAELEREVKRLQEICDSITSQHRKLNEKADKKRRKRRQEMEAMFSKEATMKMHTELLQDETRNLKDAAKARAKAKERLIKKERMLKRILPSFHRPYRASNQNSSNQAEEGEWALSPDLAEMDVISDGRKAAETRDGKTWSRDDGHGLGDLNGSTVRDLFWMPRNNKLSTIPEDEEFK